jgi:hypothetical protein
VRRAVQVAALAAASAGCLGPLLPLPGPGPHEKACELRTCPDQAALLGGVVEGSTYDRDRRQCVCLVRDDRGLGHFVWVDPHRGW